jgi:hypothetical protein
LRRVLRHGHRTGTDNEIAGDRRFEWEVHVRLNPVLEVSVLAAACSFAPGNPVRSSSGANGCPWVAFVEEVSWTDQG